LDILGNLLLLMPIAAVVVLGTRPPESRGSAAWNAALIACLVSGTIEVAQFWIPGRYVEPWDVALNTAGASIGVFALAEVHRHAVPPGVIMAAVGIATFLAMLGGLGGASVLANDLRRMEMWDPTFPVVVGDEATGGRRYSGQIADARICGGEGSSRVCADPGATLEERDRLTDVAELTQRVEITARVRSESDTQQGPARIITFSRDAVTRNITLGQVDRTLWLRVRSHLGGDNGSELSFLLPESIQQGSVASVSVLYTPAQVEMRVEQNGRVTAAEFPAGLLAGWRHLGLGLLEPHDMDLSAVFAAVMVIPPIGLATAWLLPAGLFGVLGVAVLGGPFFVSATQGLLGIPTDKSHLAIAALASALGAGLGLLDRSRLRRSLARAARVGTADSDPG
jgi:hypothetical protein